MTFPFEALLIENEAREKLLELWLTLTAFCGRRGTRASEIENSAFISFSCRGTVSSSLHSSPVFHPPGKTRRTFSMRSRRSISNFRLATATIQSSSTQSGSWCTCFRGHSTNQRRGSKSRKNIGESTVSSLPKVLIPRSSKIAVRTARTSGVSQLSRRAISCSGLGSSLNCSTDGRRSITRIDSDREFFLQLL